jgi:large subunit ribosomal protein L41
MKPTQMLAKRVRRLALTTKMTNKGFYKGTGTGSTGSHTKHGGYVIDWEKVRTYVVPPNLKDCKVGVNWNWMDNEILIGVAHAICDEEDKAY